MEAVEEKKTLGNEAYKNKDYVTAITLYKESIALCNDNSEVLNVLYANLSAAYLSLKQFEDAVQAARKCLQVDPNFLKAHLRLSSALKEQNKIEEAYEAVTNGIKVGKAQVNSSANKKKSKVSGLSELKKLQATLKQELDSKNKINNPQRRTELNEQEMKAIEELQTNLHDNLIKGKKAIREKERAKNETRRIDLTIKQLGVIDSKVESYVAVGRMFLKQNMDTINENLKARRINSEETKEKMEKMEAFYDKKIRNTQSNMSEIIKGS